MCLLLSAHLFFIYFLGKEMKNMKKQLKTIVKPAITAVLLMALLASCFSMTGVSAAEDYEEETAQLYSISGDGSEEDPFVISTQEDLMLVSDFPDCCFVLANDLEVTGDWEPLCALTDPFSGTFDGNGHTISGVSITKDYEYNGLFAQNSGTIRNVDLDISISRSGIPAQRYFGTIVGQNNAAGIIENCNVNYSVAVSCSANYSRVSSFVGGITGTNDGKVTHCRASGSVTPKGGKYDDSFYRFYVGGLTGDGNGGTFTECYAEITVPSSAYSHLGGFVGSSSKKDICTFERCATFPMFTVGAQTTAYGVGPCGTFTDCYIIGSSTASALCGFSSDRSTTTNCYSVMSGVTYGFNTNGTETNCFYDKTVSGCTNTGHGEPKTTAAMKMKATYTKAGWDFENVWGIDPAINDGYPYLLWEYAEEEEPEDEPETYAVTFDANGGDGAPASQVKTEGEDLVLSFVVPEHEQYTFNGWLGSDGNTYQPRDTYSADAELTLTAQWTEAVKPVFGDLNGDGKLDLLDLNIMMQAIAAMLS